AAQPRHAADSIAPRADAERQIEVGRSALIACHALTLAKAGPSRRSLGEGGSVQPGQRRRRRNFFLRRRLLDLRELGIELGHRPLRFGVTPAGIGWMPSENTKIL